MDKFSKFGSYSRFLTWFMASLLVVLAAGCGSGLSDVASIAVTPATASVPIGGTQRFVATGTSSNGTSADISNTVTWTSGASLVAAIASSGVATGVSAGTATITATSGGKSGSATLTVTTALGPAPVALGTAQNFAVIAAATISNAAFATAITGDMGLSPNGQTSITGFPPGTVNGAIFTGIATSTAGLARADAGTAYQAARTAGAAPGFIAVAGNIGGQTLHPGVYHSGSSLAIQTSPLTLDPLGDANAVWIFDMDTTLTTTSGGNVVLIVPAQAKNVFWRVGSSATLGAAIFKGTILADTSITLGTTAIDVAGRLLAGSVTASGAVSFNDAAHIVARPLP